MSHWSGRTLPARVSLIDGNFAEIYSCFYKQLSWSVHAGLEGVLNLKPETFAYMCAIAFQLAVLIYEQLIVAIIKEFRLTLTNPDIHDKLKFARLVTQTKNAEEEALLRRGLGL